MSFGTFDLETVGLGGSFLNAGAFYNNEYSYFESLNSLIIYMLKSKCKVWYAHNSGKYDTRYFFDYFISMGYEIKPLVIHGSIAKFSVYKGTRKFLEIRDSFLLLSSSLKKLTFDFDVKHKKLELEQDYNNMKITEQEKEYLEYDVIGLYEVLESFFKMLEERNIKPKLTYSSCAMADFKTNYPKQYSLIKNIDTKKLRTGYFGGRTEVFKTHFKSNNTFLKCYDINSLYPYVMKHFKYPIGNFTTTVKPITTEYISEIEWSCPKHIKYPLLPIKKDGKLLFCTGHGQGVYSRHEIEKAQELGYKIKFIRSWNFKQSEFLFSDYVDFWYDIKCKSKGSKRSLAKLMLNSLYGKFGTRSERERYIINPNKDWIKKNHKKWGLHDFGHYELWSDKFKFTMPYVNVPIIIYVTSLSRLQLYKYIEMCGDDLYYCDTDSVFTTKEIPVSDEIGGMKLEKQCKEAYFLRPKVYGLKLEDGKELFKAKGFDNKLLKFNAYKQAHMNKDYSLFTQNKTGIGGFKTTTKRFGKFICSYDIKKSIISEYNKRIICSDGINTKPIHLNSS